jgi:hypothetical protein
MIISKLSCKGEEMIDIEFTYCWQLATGNWLGAGVLVHAEAVGAGRGALALATPRRRPAALAWGV